MRRWLPDATAGLLVFLLALAETVVYWDLGPDMGRASLAVVVGTAVAVGVVRRAPSLSVLLVWATLAVQVAAWQYGAVHPPVLLTQLSVTFVIFGAARWGTAPTLWLSGLSLPLGAYIAVRLLGPPLVETLSGVANLYRMADVLTRLGGSWRLSAMVLLTLVLGVPWLLGLVVRTSANARARAAESAVEISRAETAREQARQLADAREEQARLARDVHDVVGHSLAVILAQAESAQYLPDDDPAALKATLATVATSARRSLRDIRQVLTATRDQLSADELDRLIDDLTAGGHDVVSTQWGTPPPLAPEQATAAVRVLQEMLTNAIRHGRRDGAIIVERHWPDGTAEGELRIEVRNSTDAAPSYRPGQGLTGMRERLEAVGGRLATERRGDIFAATARMPVGGRP